MEFRVKIEENEYWWGGAVSDGAEMPLDSRSEYYLDARVNDTYNQFNGVFLSNQGRFIHFDGGAEISVRDGVLKVSGTEGEIRFGEGHGDLKGAQQYVAATFFQKAEKKLNPDYMIEPQFCSWVETLKDVTGEKLIAYAKSVREKGLDGKLLIVDDGWSVDYGDWTFDSQKFPDPKKTVEALNELGFDVALWVVPFVNEGCADFETLKNSDAFVKTRDGNIHIAEWWNGKSAVLDLSKPSGRNWIEQKLDRLVADYGLSGFKFDAGDAMYYPEGDVSPNRHSELWAELAEKYAYAELRACVGKGGAPIAQRLSDKSLSWEKGMKILIPNIIQSGLLGYYYCCGDMVGGGNISDYENLQGLDTEFYVRSCQCSTLFPIVQFSYSIWNKSYALLRAAIQLCKTREYFKPYLHELIERAAQNNEPIVRSLEYEFPKSGFAEEKYSFMLGEKYLVAPVVEQGQKQKIVRLPEGWRWKYLANGEIYERECVVSCGEDALPIFEKSEK